MLPTRPKRHQVAWKMANVDVDDVRGCLERGDKHPGVIPGAGYEIEATGVMFWVSEGGGVHQTWVSTLTHPNSRESYPTLVVVGDLGTHTSVARGVVFEGPARGWGGGLPWKVPWQRPEG